MSHRRWRAHPYCWLFAALLLISVTAPAVAATAGSDLPVRIVVSYQHMGWGLIEESFAFDRAAGQGDYRLRGSYRNRDGNRQNPARNVAVADVKALVDAVRAPAWSHSRGVREVASRIRRGQLIPDDVRYPDSTGRCSAQTQLVLGGQYVKNKGTGELVDEYFGEGMRWTDDDPFAAIQLIWSDGRQQMLHSDSQRAMLLPWRIGKPTNTRDTGPQNWSVDVSERLRAVVPSDSYLHERLDGLERMARSIQDDVGFTVRELCDERGR